MQISFELNIGQSLWPIGTAPGAQLPERFWYEETDPNPCAASVARVFTPLHA